MKNMGWRDCMYYEQNLGYRYQIRPDGIMFDKIRKKRINPSGQKHNYPKVRIHFEDGSSTIVPIHILVASTFVEGYEPGMVVNHIDENKKNYNCNNLQWVTPQQNTIHSIYKRGKNYQRNRRQYEDNKDVKLDYSGYYTITDLRNIVKHLNEIIEQEGYNESI